VAVVVDGVPGQGGAPAQPRSAAELDKLTKLVRSAVGIDEKRGDMVTVESVPFIESEPTAAPAPPPSLVSRLPAPARKYLPYVGAGLGALLLLLALVALRRRTKKREAEGEKAPATPPQLTTPEPAPKLPEIRTPAQLKEEAMRQAKLDPATASLVVRYWLGTGVEQDTKREAA
jgi:flagellar M-ring protein FliF